MLQEDDLEESKTLIELVTECDSCGITNKKLYFDKRLGENLCQQCRSLTSFKINKRSKEEDEH